ncbi:MAG: DsbA family protein [Pseudomonadota bacterium]
MTRMIDRRTALTLTAAALASTGLSAPAFADTPEPHTGDVVLGDENAPVTVIEYASLTCPHCARFHIRTWPEFKTNYVETGKVRFIMREVYFDRLGLYASMVARCGGAGAFYPLVDQYLKQQDRWTRAPENQLIGEIRKIGRINGLSREAMDACLSDQEYAKTLVENYQRTATEDAVQSTPTFVINGDKVSGDMSYAEFSALVDKHL